MSGHQSLERCGRLLKATAMTSIVSFNFEQLPVRTVMRDGDPWFVAADLADILGYRNAPDMVRTLDDDEQHTHNVRSRAAK
jgi:prophage antirepressor-like protein